MPANKKATVIAKMTRTGQIDDKQIVAFVVYHLGFQRGFIQVEDYECEADARAAAEKLAADLAGRNWVSPFERHRHMIMGSYGTSAKMRRFVLSLYNGNAFKVDLSDVAGMDSTHFAATMELISSYHKLGENDKVHMRLAEEIKKAFPRKDRE